MLSRPIVNLPANNFTHTQRSQYPIPSSNAGKAIGVPVQLEELTRTHDRWLSIEDNPPPKIGWYAVIRRFRDPDRFRPGSGYWDGTSWDHRHILSWDHGHILARSPQVFANENVAEAWAITYQQAWEPFGIPASIGYNASEGSFALEGDKNVAKKEERTHAGS